MLVATWLTAVATSVLAVFAFFTAVLAYAAFRKQSAEVGALIEDRNREAAQRHRAQAAQVFTWVGELPLSDGEAPRPAACVRNTSGQPIYDINVGWGSSFGAGTWRVLLPGNEDAIKGAGTSVADGTVPIWIEFRDAAGVRWRATSRGELTEVPER
jgi:hypothetical protein